MRIESVPSNYTDKMAGAYADSLVQTPEWLWLTDCLQDAIEDVKADMQSVDVSTQQGVCRISKMQGYIRAIQHLLIMPPQVAETHNRRNDSGSPDDPDELPDIPRGM